MRMRGRLRAARWLVAPVMVLAAALAVAGPAVAGDAETGAKGGTGTAADAGPCAHDRDALLALEERAFDQDLANGGGGWRAIAARPGCAAVAADLVADWRARHGGSGIVGWHEGQLRAEAGQVDRAIPLLAGARMDPARDLVGWNHYVDATVAFLRGDRDALLRARETLAAVEYVPMDNGLPPPRDGWIEIPRPEGQPPVRMRWPPNSEVVDGLVACFGRPYAEAYGGACRTGRE